MTDSTNPLPYIYPKGDAKTEWKPTKLENPAFVCRKCGSDNVWYRPCDCQDFKDIEYHCRGCGRRWWFEGADA